MMRLSALAMLVVTLLCGALSRGAEAADYIRPCVAKVENGRVPIEILVRAQGAYDCTSKQTVHGAGDFLTRLAVPADVAGLSEPLVLRISSVWQGAAQVLFVYADGTTASLDYESATTARYMTIGALPQFHVPQRASPLAEVYIATHRSANLRGIIVGAQIFTAEESFREQKMLFVLFAWFFGMSVALLGYNLAMWVALKQPFQLSYCLMLAALLVYVFSSSGSVMLVFEGLDNNDRLRLNYVVQALAVAAALDFMFRFFTRQVIGATLDRLRWVAGGGMITVAALFALLAPQFIFALDRAFFVFGLANALLLVPAMTQVWRSGSPFFWLFTLAWIAPVAAGVVRLLYGFDLLPFSFWLDNANTVALCVEAMVSIPIIVTRLRTLLDERDGALAAQRLAMQLASSDPLTGLYNRRAFFDRALGSTGLHRLLLIDIDHFKRVNDQHGHDVGDDVLREMARLVQEMCPAEGLAVRLGGEEFAVLMPARAEKQLTPDMLLSAIRSRAMPLGLPITASLGVATGEVTSEAQWLELFRRADAALYRAKAEGRNRVCYAPRDAEGRSAAAA